MSGPSARFTFKLSDAGIDSPVGPPSLGAGMAEVSGSGVVLRFAFRTEDLAEAFASKGAREARLDVAQIRSAELKAGLLGGRLVIEARDPSATDGIPGCERGRLVLKVPRRDLEAARRAESLLAAGLRGGKAEG